VANSRELVELVDAVALRKLVELVELVDAVELVEDVDAVELVEDVDAVELVEDVDAVELVEDVDAVELFGRRGAGARARARGRRRRVRGPLVTRAELRARASAARAQLRALKGVRAQTASEKRADVRAWRARGREGVAAARAQLAELTLALKTATAATRGLARYVAPGAAALVEREALKALDEQKKRHGAELRSAAKMAKGADAEIARYRAATAEQRAAGRARAARAAEVLAESDDRVRNDLDTEDERLLFELVRAHIQPTARMTRTEAFFQWMHDHASNIPGILARYHTEQADREWAAIAEARDQDEADEAVRRVRAEPVKVPAWMRSELGRTRKPKQTAAPPPPVVIVPF
jgi:hypothetical protein